jgi:NTP pyrophosphatase (non-canonical NTP hydrolase)
MANLNEMPIVAVHIVANLRSAGWTGDLRPQGTLALAEEAGEFTKAARRYLGMARRTGTKYDVAMELADVVITAFVAANVFDIDLPAAIEEKLKEIFDRPWRDQPPGELSTLVDNPVTGEPLGWRS